MMAEKKDLSTLSKPELIEMLGRQEKLLANRRFLQSLPDKGEKVSQMAKKIKELIATREKIENTVSQFERLAVSQLQKTGVEVISDDNDDDDDCVEKEERQELVRQTDNSTNNEDGNSPYEEQLSKNVKKDDLCPRTLSSQKSPVKGNLSKGNKVSKQASTKTWDYESSVTPRSYVFQEVKPVSLEESFKLLQDQDKRQKDLQADYAAQKLQDQQSGRTTATGLVLPVVDSTQYRGKNDGDCSSDENEQEEDYVAHNEIDSDDEDADGLATLQE